MRRLALLGHGLRADRDAPDLERLARIDDPERFCWKVLPYVARTFAVSISLLPHEEAQAAAVAYLYARMLDSYEDMLSDSAATREALLGFARRFGAVSMERPPALPMATARDRRDQVYALLVDRCPLIDEVFLDVKPVHRADIVSLVDRMAQGMVWASETFERQGGALVSDDQVLRYCRIVIGEPSHFVLRLVAGRPLTELESQEANRVSEMIQLANITRDIERDLSRGVAYHPALVPYLHNGASTGAEPAIRRARLHLTLLALQRARSYRRLQESLPHAATGPNRAAAVAMLGFTEAHYRRQEALLTPEGGRPPSNGRVVATALAAGLSSRWASKSLQSSEGSLIEVRDRIGLLEAEVAKG